MSTTKPQKLSNPFFLEDVKVHHPPFRLSSFWIDDKSQSKFSKIFHRLVQPFCGACPIGTLTNDQAEFLTESIRSISCASGLERRKS